MEDARPDDQGAETRIMAGTFVAGAAVVGLLQAALAGGRPAAEQNVLQHIVADLMGLVWGMFLLWLLFLGASVAVRGAAMLRPERWQAPRRWTGAGAWLSFVGFVVVFLGTLVGELAA